MFTKGGVRKLLHVTFTLELGQPQPQLGRALLMAEEKRTRSQRILRVQIKYFSSKMPHITAAHTQLARTNHKTGKYHPTMFQRCVRQTFDGLSEWPHCLYFPHQNVQPMRAKPLVLCYCCHSYCSLLYPRPRPRSGPPTEQVFLKYLLNECLTSILLTFLVYLRVKYLDLFEYCI